MLKSVKKNNFGMTLVEVLVGMFIMTIMMGIMLVNYRGYDRKNSLVVAAYKLASDLRLVQNYSLGLKEFNGYLPDGWGIYFNKQNAINEKQYIIFADRPDSDEAIGVTLYDPGTGEDHITVKLPPGVIINSFSNGGNIAEFIVIPPDPDITITDFSGTPNEVTIELALEGSGDTKQIIINKFGLIDID